MEYHLDILKDILETNFKKFNLRPAVEGEDRNEILCREKFAVRGTKKYANCR